MPRMDMMQLLEAEFKLERTSALARVGGKIERALAEAKTLAAKLEHLPPGPARDQALKQHAEALKRADENRFYLIVQREALGLLIHDIVDEMYPMPAPITR